MSDTGIGISFGASQSHSPLVPATSHLSARNGYHVPLESLPKPSFSAPSSVTSKTYSQLLPESACNDKEDEQDLYAQIQKQSEAIRHQQEAFRAEREGWEFERSRLTRRIVSLEGLLKSSNTHSPAGSPPFAPYQQSFVPLPSNGRGTTSLTASRLPSIAEDAAAPKTPPVGAKRRTSLRRDSAPSRIDLTNAKPAFSMDGQTEIKHARIDPTRDSEMIESYSPTHDDILSPPPAAYTAHAGHTPIKIPDRPVLDMSPATSHKSARSIDNLTECNTQFNLLDSAQNGQDSNDPELQGPLKLPGLPQDAGLDCFTMDMLTKRLQDISDDPESNTPSSLRAPVNFSNDDDLTSADSSESTSEKHADMPDQDPPPPAKTSPQISGEKSPVPTPVEPDDDLTHRGIKLKKKPSCNFGAPLGQLGPLDRSRKS